MSNTPTPYIVTGASATKTSGAGFSTGSFVQGTNYGSIPISANTAKLNLPKYPPRAVPKNPGSVKLALGKLPSIYGIYAK